MKVENNSLQDWESELLRARSERLRGRKESSEDESPLWAGTFAVGPDTYALELNSLRAAVSLRLVTPVPLADSRVLGIVRHEGEILTAISLSSLLGTQGWRQDPVVLLILSLPRGGRIAVDCEEVPRAVALPEAEVAASPLDSNKPWRRLRVGEQVIHLLDLPRLVAMLDDGVARAS